MFIVLAVYRSCGPKNLQAFESKQKLWNFEMIFHFKSSKISILKTVCFFFQKTAFHYDIYIKLEFSIITFWNLKNEFPICITSFNHWMYLLPFVTLGVWLLDSTRCLFVKRTKSKWRQSNFMSLYTIFLWNLEL